MGRYTLGRRSVECAPRRNKVRAKERETAAAAPTDNPADTGGETIGGSEKRTMDKDSLRIMREEG